MAEHEHYDVIVVGAGGSGLAAACSAAELGARVLVLERQPQPGGTTGIAVGSFTAAKTDLQRRQGIDDQIDHHRHDAARFAPPEIESRNNEPLRSFFLSQAAATLDWLVEKGVPFVGPHPEPPNRVPRMHNAVPGAKAYITCLHTEFIRLGGRLICEAEVTRLLEDANSPATHITGVEYRTSHGQCTQATAERGVILACGDYANHRQMIAKHKGQDYAAIEGINEHALGLGHQLVESVGGELQNMDVTYGPELRFVPSSQTPFQQWLPASGIFAQAQAMIYRWLPRWIQEKFLRRLLVTWQHPEDQLYEDGAVLVNREGKRFTDETHFPSREIAVAQQTDGVAYLLLDRRLVDRFSQWPHFVSTAPDIAYAYVDDYLRLRPDVARQLVSLEDGEAYLDSHQLRHSIDEFNRFVAGEHEDPHGRARSPKLKPLDRGPWVLLGPVKAYFTTTEGGASIDTSCRVLGGGVPIPGLYAVGQNGLGGMILWGHGLHIAWAMTSGRIAGKAIVQEEQ